MEKDILKRKIEFLVEFYYNKFDFLRKESLDTLKKKALDKYLESGLTIEEIQIELEKEVLERKKLENSSLGTVSNDMEIKENHHNIYDTLEELAYLLRMAKVDYYIEGGLVGYLRYNKESNRVHDNINITINEKDYDKFKSMCDILGIKVIGKDLDNKNDNSSNVVLSSFERLEDGSIKTINYDDNGERKEVIINPKLADMVYGDEKVNFRGYELNVLPAEYIYFLKDGSSMEKDKIDTYFLKDKIDMRGLKLIQDYSNFEYKSNTNSELSSMMNDSTKADEKKSSNELSINKQKVLEKKDNNNNNSGYADTNAISGMSILSIAIMIICIFIMIIMYLK